MRGFWKTGKELSDRAEISRISSWALGDLNLWISARSDNVKGGGGLAGRNFRPDFPHEGKVGGGWNLAGFLVGARATKCIPPHPSATTETEDRLTLSWFASLKRHECASLILVQMNWLVIFPQIWWILKNSALLKTQNRRNKTRLGVENK